MINKEYFPLSFIIILIGISCTRNSKNEKLINDLIYSIETSIQELDFETTEMINQSRSRLRNETKRKYRPIEKAITIVNHKIDSVTNHLNKTTRKLKNEKIYDYQNEFELVEQSLNSLKLELKDEYLFLLSKYGEQFGLNQHDIKVLQEKNLPLPSKSKRTIQSKT